MVRLMVGRDLGELFGHRARARDEVALELRSVTTRPKVQRLSLTVRAGEVVGLGGLVGAGRSELARGIVRLDRLRGGEVRVVGRRRALRAPGRRRSWPASASCPRTASRKRCCWCAACSTTSPCACPRRSRGWASSIAAREPAGRRPLARRLRDRDAVDRAGGATSSPAATSRRSVFARWLAREPRILILDEPTRGIDVGAKAEIYRLIDELAAAGIAILLISSELPELLGLTDRILVMRAGAIVGELPTAAATEEAVLAPRHGPARTARRPPHDRRKPRRRDGRRRASGRGSSRRVGTQNLSLLLALVILVAIFGALRPDMFFLPRNLVNIGLAITILGILAMSQTVVIVSGGLDISVGHRGARHRVDAIAMQATGSAALGHRRGDRCGGPGGARQRPDHHLGPVNAVIATLGTMAI